MHERSALRRGSPESAPPRYKSKRFLAVVVTMIAFAALVTVTQVSQAADRKKKPVALPVCPPAAAAGKAEQKGADAGKAEQKGADAGKADADAKADANKDDADAKADANKDNEKADADAKADANKDDDKADADKAAAKVPPGDLDPGDGSGVDPAAGDVAKPDQQSGVVDGGRQNGAKVKHHVGDTGDGKQPNDKDKNCVPASNPNSGREGFLGNNCDKSRLGKHTGLPAGNKCSSTEFGEVPSAAKSPSLLITKAPSTVRVNKPFNMKVSTRNLVRDRFLPAATGGYYKESSFLTKDGLVRGHLHTACQMLSSTNSAPDPAPVPAFFVATEDGEGGARADTITINIPGLPSTGTARCAIWAGDGSHRIPMMERANQTPAFDAVRIRVTR
jgi:hypothetical protein